MKIALASIGSRGDIQPYIALALALKEAGHNCFLATLPWAKELLESYGIEHRPVGTKVNLDKGVNDIIDQSDSNRKGFLSALNFIFDTLRECHDDFLELFKEADLVIGHGVTGLSEAEMLEKPYVMSSITPMGLPTLQAQTRSRILNFMIDLPGKIMETTLGRPYNRFRKDIGAPPSNANSPGAHPHLAILPVSSAIMQSRKNWKPHTEIVGYFFTDSPRDYELPPQIESFLSTEKKIVFITFGSMLHSRADRDRIFKLVSGATQAAGVKAILLMSDLSKDNRNVPANMLLVDRIPYPYILPKVSLVVHHFGFGTTAEVLKMGIPTIPVPHIFDQKIRAKDLYRKGLTSRPLNWKKLSADTLARAIHQALDNKDLKVKAEEIADHIRQEDGLRRAVDLIEETFGK